MPRQAVISGSVIDPGRASRFSDAVARPMFEAMFRGEGDSGAARALLGTLPRGARLGTLAAMLEAAQARLQSVEVDAARPTVVVPAYGRAQSEVAGIPLLAGLLADCGLQVVVHGATQDSGVAQVMRALGLAPVQEGMQAQLALQRGDPVFVPLERLSPALAGLLTTAPSSALRDAVHWVAGLLDPTTSAGALRLLAVPARSLHVRSPQRLLRATGAQALLVQGAVEDGVAPLRARARFEWIRAGRSEGWIDAPVSGPLDVPTLPDPQEASATARWVQSVLAGERPVPTPMAEQIEVILQGLGRRPASS